jgi:hypothetical protein
MPLPPDTLLPSLRSPLLPPPLPPDHLHTHHYRKTEQHQPERYHDILPVIV